MEKDYCLRCGGDRVLVSGEPCPDCQKSTLEFLESGTSTLTVPEQFRDSKFDYMLVPSDCGEYYPSFMANLYKDIINMKIRNKNIFLGSPSQHSKKHLAFGCIQQLFRRNVETFPLFDIMEIKRIMHDMDLGRDPVYLQEYGVSAMTLYTCPYLFVIIPGDTSYATFDAAATLKDRRVRRGMTTIFMYSGTWEFLVANDKKGTFKYALGDGSYGSIENNSFWPKGGDSE